MLQQIRVSRNVRQNRVDEEPRLDHALRRRVCLQGGEGGQGCTATPIGAGRASEERACRWAG